MPQAASRWLSLRVGVESHAIVVRYGDRRSGSMVAARHPRARRLYQQIVERFPTVRIPADLDELLEVALAGRPVRVTERGLEPVPFPVFLEFPPAHADLPWDIWLRELLAARSFHIRAADLIQVIRLNPARAEARGPMALPLNILTVDSAGEHALAGLFDRPWYADDPVVREHGLTIRQATTESLRTALQEPDGIDVVLSDTENLASVLRTLRQVAVEEQPRLLIELGHVPEEAARRPAVGEARLLVPPMSPERTRNVITDFLYGIIHDQPLHEAVKETERRHARLPAPLRLVASPLSDQALRLSDAVGPLYDAVTSLTVPQLEGLTASLRLAGAEAAAARNLTDRLRRGFQGQIPLLRDVVERGRDVAIDFGREITGLKPLAEMRQRVQAAGESERQMAQRMVSAVRTSDEREQLRQAQGRRVDITMEQLARELTDPVGQVKPGDCLLAGARYRIRVSIGARSPVSLIVTEAPSVDPLLPRSEDAEGHHLDVVVYGKHFEVIGVRAKPLFLPTFGNSDTVWFEVAAPARSGAARLRLAIYHKNHLVQSFVLNAWIGDWPIPDSPALGFALEYSRTAKFANVSALGERAISIGVNANGSATHSLDVKSDAAAVEFSLAQQLLEQQIERYRKLLKQATFVGDQPRFSTFPDPNDPITADFHEFTRKFADLGRDLYRALLLRRQLQERLRALAGSAGKTIQIVRFDPNFVFPWPVVYDFELPAPITGAPLPEVCRGTKRDSSGAVVACGHGPTDQVYCINGFWGVRHVLEELIGQSGDSHNAIAAITRPQRDRAVRLAVDVLESHTRDMQTAFVDAMKTAYADVTPSESVLDLLWSEADRPAVLTIVGHVETKDIDGEPPGLRIVLPGGKGLRAEEIVDRVGRSSWKQQPHSLILLMGCESGLIELGTLTGFVTALASAPAAAVVGAECVAFSRLLTRFANDLTLALWRGGQLGKSMADFRRRLLVAGNPLAFTFHAVGGADVHLALGGK